LITPAEIYLAAVVVAVVAGLVPIQTRLQAELLAQAAVAVVAAEGTTMRLAVKAEKPASLLRAPDFMMETPD
jgi:hypothetical protein